jgi:hypothetical protein
VVNKEGKLDLNKSPQEDNV